MIYVILNTPFKLEFAESVISCKPDRIQFRHKGNWATAVSLAQELCTMCQQANIPFLINDRVDVALAIDADGVHLGQEDLPISVARKLLGPNKIIGGTASCLEQALKVQMEGANYMGLGHIFPTSSKEKPYPPIGLETLREVSDTVTIPIVAIGGINEHNARAVFQAGASGVAVLSAPKQHPKETLKRLKECYSKK